MNLTTASLFTGGGLADIGARQAGFTNLWGIEIEPWIAEHTSSQLGHRVVSESILNLSPYSFDVPYHLHASPPCPSFSLAKNSRGETEMDMKLAHAVGNFIDVLRPELFTLENVWLYRNSESFRLILNTIKLVYGDNWDYTHVNFADLGVPQSRRRLILRASKKPLPPLPEKEEWVGWYQAVEDIIGTFPDTQFAPWQLERMEKAGIKVDQTALVEGVSKGQRPPTVRDEGQPAFTIEAGGGGRVHRAFIIAGGNKNSARPRTDEEPSHTIGDVGRVGNLPRAFVVGGTTDSYGESVTIPNSDAPYMTVTSNHYKHAQRAYTEGRIVRITPRGLARFQTLPDWYELPESKQKAVHLIGNGVPCLGMEKILRGMLDG